MSWRDISQFLQRKWLEEDSANLEQGFHSFTQKKKIKNLCSSFRKETPGTLETSNPPPSLQLSAIIPDQQTLEHNRGSFWYPPLPQEASKRSSTSVEQGVLQKKVKQFCMIWDAVVSQSSSWRQSPSKCCGPSAGEPQAKWEMGLWFGLWTATLFPRHKFMSQTEGGKSRSAESLGCYFKRYTNQIRTGNKVFGIVSFAEQL